MDRRSYLLSVFEDTLERIKDDAELLKTWMRKMQPLPIMQLCRFFKYIHYKITEESEQLKVHKMVCNIVRLPKMQQVCDALVELMRQEQILSTIDQTAMLTELRRLGLPSDLKGFSDKNFYSFYRTK